MPTAAELLRAGRTDLYRAVQRYGGFAAIASHNGLLPTRAPRRSAHQLIASGLAQVPVGNAALKQAQLPRKSVLPPPPPPPLEKPPGTEKGRQLVTQPAALARCTGVRKKRRERGYWLSWRHLELEIRAFADRVCGGHMPLQRQLLDHGRSDLVNAVRMHGGQASVMRRAALEPDPQAPKHRAKGHWEHPSVLHAELLTFTKKNGYNGLMPRRDQLLRAGRTDLCYAIEKYGGFSTVAADLHLLWYGPSSFWRVFRNVQKRLLVFVKKQGLGNVMPSMQTLHKHGRMDLVYGVAMHGGAMVVAWRIGLEVRYPEREASFWGKPANVQRELEAILEIQPLEAQRFMPTSVALVQAGRADLATAIRDHGGWLYYAQRLGLRFAFDVRKPGFWQSDANVLRELKNYVEMRYGTWEHPGKPVGLELGVAQAGRRGARRYMPSVEMLKRDGRSDIAFAIERYHGGMEVFAAKHALMVAEDVVQIQPAEVLMDWVHFSRELDTWIQQHGANGIMPTKQDLIRTGRHDLRYATYKHGGALKVSQRLQLVFVEAGLDEWLPKWLGMQAGKMGLAMQLYSRRDVATRRSEALREALDEQLAGRVLGKQRALVTESSLLRRGAFDARRLFAVPPGAKGKRSGCLEGGRVGGGGGRRRISVAELEAVRRRLKHLPPDDIITV